MSNEKKVLAAILNSRNAYETIEAVGKTDSFSEQGRIILNAASEFYSRDRAAKSCDYELVGSAIARTLQAEKHRNAFKSLLDELKTYNVSPENVAHDFIEMHRETVGAKLASALLMGKSAEAVAPLLEEYEQCSTEILSESSGPAVLRGTPLAEITKTYDERELIQLWPSVLNDRLDGGLLRGHHVVVFARPEAGKTAFLVNAVAGFLSQGLTVLYVGNEDPSSDIVLRVVCRLTKRNKYDVLENPELSDELARKAGYENFILASLTPGTPKEIEALVEEYRPDVLLIDQLRNIAIPSKDGNRVVQLEQAATAARNIAKRFGVLTISVTQAGDSASGKAVLDMGDVDSSNTGIPAQADVMVGIGGTQEDFESGRRILSLPKNKRSGKHDYFPVKLDPTLSRLYTE